MTLFNILVMYTDKIRQLITNILMYYANSEIKSKAKYELQCNSEFDSIVTQFERLSNLGLIVIKTNLDERDVRVVIHLLQAIVEEDYYIFEPEIIDDYLDKIFANCKGIQRYC